MKISMTETDHRRRSYWMLAMAAALALAILAPVVVLAA